MSLWSFIGRRAARAAFAFECERMRLLSNAKSEAARQVRDADLVRSVPVFAYQPGPIAEAQEEDRAFAEQFDAKASKQNSVAKASEDNGATGEPDEQADSVAGDVSRPSPAGEQPGTIPFQLTQFEKELVGYIKRLVPMGFDPDPGLLREKFQDGLYSEVIDAALDRFPAADFLSGIEYGRYILLAEDAGAVPVHSEGGRTYSTADTTFSLIPEPVSHLDALQAEVRQWQEQAGMASVRAEQLEDALERATLRFPDDVQTILDGMAEDNKRKVADVIVSIVSEVLRDDADADGESKPHDAEITPPPAPVDYAKRTAQIIALAQKGVRPSAIADHLGVPLKAVTKALTKARKAGARVPRFSTSGVAIWPDDERPAGPVTDIEAAE